MKKPSVTVLANFFIDNEERCHRMKSSFNSFRNLNPDQWLVNIRGSFKFQAKKFLKHQLHNKIKLFDLESRRGWFHDTKIIASYIDTSYVLIWIEDHILMDSVMALESCLIEMEKFKVDQLYYSFFTNEMRQTFSFIPTHKKGEFITVKKLDYEACLKIQRIIKKDFYATSLLSIMSKNHFIKVICSPKPYLKRWPRSLPFDFEKKSNDQVCPIIWHAIPNKELFASIDDDKDEKDYSLISRGIYKSLIPEYDTKKIEYLKPSLFKKRLKKIIPKFLLNYVSNLYTNVRRFIYTINIFYNK